MIRGGLLLRRVRWWSGGDEGTGDLRIRAGRLVEIGRALRPGRRDRTIELADHLVLPGLVNAHDHLGLDLLPHLGRPPYRSFYDWAADVYAPERAPLAEILRVAPADRLRAGGYRNLLSGATTVAHHDPWASTFRRGFPVRVLRRYGWSHSPGLAPDPIGDSRRAGARPWFIHAAEGTDERAAAEIGWLDARGLLGRTTVLVHGIALDARAIDRLEATGCALVWCPASNELLYQRQPPVDQLRGRVRLALGTDSTISGSVTLLDELRAARDTGLVEPAGLLDLVTRSGAEVLGLEDGTGELRVGGRADLVAVPDRGGPVADQLLELRPPDLAFVALGGRPALADPEIAETLDLSGPAIDLPGGPKWVRGRLTALRDRIERRVESRALATSPVFRLLGGGMWTVDS